MHQGGANDLEVPGVSKWKVFTPPPPPVRFPLTRNRAGIAMTEKLQTWKLVGLKDFRPYWAHVRRYAMRQSERGRLCKIGSNVRRDNAVQDGRQPSPVECLRLETPVRRSCTAAGST